MKEREILQNLYFSEFARMVLASFFVFSRCRSMYMNNRCLASTTLSTREYNGIFLWCDGPDTKCIVSETSEQGLSISRPGNGNTFRLSSFFAHISVSRLELIDDGPRKPMGTKPWYIKEINSLALKIENFYTTSGGGTQPVSVWWEDKGIDNVAGFERV